MGYGGGTQLYALIVPSDPAFIKRRYISAIIVVDKGIPGRQIIFENIVALRMVKTKY